MGLKFKILKKDATYVELEPTKENRTWRFKLLKDFEIIIPSQFKSLKMVDNTGVVRGYWGGSVLTISKDYAWNGCSPKHGIFGQWLGTPDYPETLEASLVHDILYQFSTKHGLSRKECDDIFHEIMKKRNFKFSRLYYQAVRLFGGRFFK